MKQKANIGLTIEIISKRLQDVLGLKKITAESASEVLCGKAEYSVTHRTHGMVKWDSLTGIVVMEDTYSLKDTKLIIEIAIEDNLLEIAKVE